MGRPGDKGDSPRDEGRRESGRAAPHHTSDKTSRADSYGGDLSPPAAGLSIHPQSQTHTDSHSRSSALHTRPRLSWWDLDQVCELLLLPELIWNWLRNGVKVTDWCWNASKTKLIHFDLRGFYFRIALNLIL